MKKIDSFVLLLQIIMEQKVRLNKFISDSGYCSRRQADLYIEQGRVTVNMRDCLEKGAMILPTDKVEVDGEQIKVHSRRVYIALNKPVGITCTTDLADKTNIIDYVGHKERIFPIGRLDKQSQGLIFLTNDGDIVNKILRAGNNHEKEYVVTVDKPITDDFARRMANGVRILGEVTRPCKFTRETTTTFRIVLTQGMNRQIRRMCEALNYQVEKLNRVRIMNITLSRIPLGEWRYFTPDEIEQINELVSDSSGTREASEISRDRSRPMKSYVAARRGDITGDNSADGGDSSSGRRPSKARPGSFSSYRKAGRNKR